jgi:hypothetical protein
VFVWYDSDGNITAIGTPHPDRVASVHPIAAKVNVVYPKYINYPYITASCRRWTVALRWRVSMG